jgi:hypothetical protein
MSFVSPKLQRVFDPKRPLYAWRDLTFPGGATVKRGELVAVELLALLKPEVVKQMHWVRQLDHLPIAGVTPLEQMPQSTVVLPPRRDASQRGPKQRSAG